MATEMHITAKIILARNKLLTSRVITERIMVKEMKKTSKTSCNNSPPIMDVEWYIFRI